MSVVIVLFVMCFASDFFSVNACTIDNDHLYDITDGRRVGSTIIEDGVKYTSENYFTHNGRILGCVCDATKCLRKCCDDGSYPARINKTRVCRPEPPGESRSIKKAFKEMPETKDYNFIHLSHICTTQMSLALPVTNLKDDLHDGILEAYGMSLNYNDFCLDYVKHKLTSIICVNSDEEAIINFIGT
ncbi:hypothetical protein HHI36_020596 [Cryptolaemus montrouzieri]|uniref:Methuselah N-terminal domain-containing protein n=1 Tax=Cryptolaemus montrouzieri TaxID=559131 RepID=A0ABD2NBT4_9CUCU